MKVIVAGGRSFTPNKEHYEWLCNQLNLLHATEIVSGGARGADAFGEYTAKKLGKLMTRFPADWEHFGKKAGPIRNIAMVEYSDALIVFPGGKGTKHIIDFAKERGLIVIEFENRWFI